jgi:soluble lytic murein transglycosylase-like protein
VIPNTYDVLIQMSAYRFLPDWDWRECKAQWWCESALKPDARSEAGALGLTQNEPDTFAESAEHLGFPRDASPFDPHYSLLAGTFYLSKMFKAWHSQGRSLIDRKRLARASYNAGLGSLLRAQGLAGGALDYASIVAMLPGITGVSNAHQTTSYVAAIETTYAELARA